MIGDLAYALGFIAGGFTLALVVFATIWAMWESRHR